MYDVGNGFRCGKTAGDDILLPRSLYNRRFNVVLIAGLAGVGVVDILPDNCLSRNDLQCPDDFLADFSHSIAALRTYQILTLQAVFYLLSG